MFNTREPDWAQKMRVELYPICVFEDRYSGCYSGGAWVAFPEDIGSREELAPMESGDCDAMSFHLPDWCAVGDTPNDAVSNLYRKIGLQRFPEYAAATRDGSSNA